MELYLSIVLMFVGLTALLWLSILGTGRYANWYKNRFVQTLNKDFESMFMFVDASKYFYIYLATLVLVPVMVFVITGNYIYILMSIILVYIAPKFIQKYLFKRRQKQLITTLPDSLIQISGSMRAGASMVIAIEAMVKETKGPISQEFSLVLREMRIGVTMDDAFENLAKRVNEDEYTLVVSAARIAKDVGGNLSETFELLADTLRRKIIMEGKIDALTSQGKLQGWVVGLLPIGMMLVLMKMEPQAMYPLLHSVVGWGFLSFILIMELLGGLMIKKIVTIDI